MVPEQSIQTVSLYDCRFTVSRAVFKFSLSISALAALGTQGHNRPQANQQTHEMTVPNELIGCIIGKGGSKIAEIRYYITSKDMIGCCIRIYMEVEKRMILKLLISVKATEWSHDPHIQL